MPLVTIQNDLTTKQSIFLILAMNQEQEEQQEEMDEQKEEMEQRTEQAKNGNNNAQTHTRPAEGQTKPRKGIGKQGNKKPSGSAKSDLKKRFNQRRQD
jgi:hypothetical protein